MKRIIKKLFGNRVIALLRRIRGSARDEAYAYYAYDADRFVSFSGAFGKTTQYKLLSKIIKEYHVVEKCLTMPERENGHGKTAAENLLASIRNYVCYNYDRGEAQFLHAIGVLKAYLKENGSAKSIDDLVRTCDSYPNVEPAVQPHFSRTKFYSDRSAAFPIFAASRHTVRNFSSKPIGEGKIASAVTCALHSPSACNRQYVKVLEVLNKDLISSVLSLQGGCRGFGHLATALLIVTVDLEGVGSAKEHNDVFTNGGMFMMSLCYAMHYYEVAHCILNWSKSPEEDMALRKILPLLDSESVVAVIACGEASDEFDVAMSPRKALSDVFRVVK